MKNLENASIETLALHAGQEADNATNALAVPIYQQLTTEERLNAGVGAYFIRLSIGFKNSKDIIADLEQALV